MEIAAVLREFGDLLEIKGSNPFRIRAYRNAVRTINDLTRSLASMVEGGEDLTELPGIGKEMANHIGELVEWGELSVLEALGQEVPRSLTDLIRLDGVGPKKAKRLWEELGVTSVDDLEQALEEDRVAGLAGFGAKSAEKIFRSIEDFRKHQGRFLLSEVDVLVRPLIRYLEEVGVVERVEVAGSYRRRKETVGDIDLLVLSEDGHEQVMDSFQAYPGVVRVEAAGGSKGRVVLRSGLPVDLRIVPRDSFGAALHYFSGSKEHNVAIRTLGVKKGLKISEYGVFSESEAEAGDSGDNKVGGAEEADVFSAVGLPWINPLLRENRGEVEAARAGELPEALKTQDIRGDLQMHSTWSDGANTLREMAEACRDRGYEYLSITDHSQAVTVAGGLKPPQVREQWEQVEEVRQLVGGIHLFRSLEVDILKDGSLDMPDEILAGLDLVLVSVHSFMNMPIAEMTKRVIRALEHPQVDILAHPTGRILNRREPFAMDVDAVLQAAAELDVAVELNAHPSRLDLHDRHVRRAKELGVKVAINTDAHSVQDLDLMRYGLDQGRRGWLESGDVLNAMSLGEFQVWKDRKNP
ncbi:MAG: DNA polymerase/3'-5' exonuclease PolX [Gemmatimonadetes bacterium]|nr:DNA polymerase/3'-5' exonuclease PolX [Gemmatimonadota bacterium]NNM07407.1 DNA polymerase/3'-5' exonuclease PolX [Gemmatimonadota bacterium]